MTQKAFDMKKRKFEWMEKTEDEEKESKMQGPKGQATTRALIFVIVVILIMLFFLG